MITSIFTWPVTQHKGAALQALPDPPRPGQTVRLAHWASATRRMRVRRTKRGPKSLCAALTITVATLSACSGSASRDPAVNLLNVEAGMTESQVLAIMGQPQRRERHGGTEFLIYASDGSNKVALVDFIPIAMVDGRVTGIGRRVYDHILRSESEGEKNSPGSSKPRR